MSQYVYACSCGWRGITVGGRPLHRGSAPTRCGACVGTALTVSRVTHPRITHVCTCGTSFLSTSRNEPQCASCRGATARAASTRRKYHWTPEKEAYLRRRYDSLVRGRTYELAQALGWPRHEVKKHARLLGLTHPMDRREFTPEEVAVIEKWTGTRASRWIARKLKRSEMSVVLKQQRMHLSRRVRDGYCVRDLEQCFGIGHHAIDRWIREGLLKAKHRGTDRAGKQGDIFKVTDQDVKAFIRNNPTAFRLDKVSQEWFLDLMLGAPAAPVETKRDRNIAARIAAAETVA